MHTKEYLSFTAREVAGVLAICDCDELKGEEIARDMLEGSVGFTDNELLRLAAYKGVSVEYLTENDSSFKRYAAPVTAVRKAIAAKLVHAGAAVEFAAEICGLTVETVSKIMF